MLRVVTKVLSRSSAKTKTKRLQVSNFALLLVCFKRHRDNEGVKDSKKGPYSTWALLREEIKQNNNNNFKNI